jgi:hypothetical protein
MNDVAKTNPPISKALIVAAWLAALALAVIAVAAVVTTLSDNSGIRQGDSWVEFEACLRANGYVAQGDELVNQQAREICDGEL